MQKAADEGRADSLVRPINELFSELPPILLNEKNTHLYKNGVGLDPKRVSGVIYDTAYEIAPYQNYCVFGADKKFIGVGHVDYQKRQFKSVKMFYNEE